MEEVDDNGVKTTGGYFEETVGLGWLRKHPELEDEEKNPANHNVEEVDDNGNKTAGEYSGKVVGCTFPRE